MLMYTSILMSKINWYGVEVIVNMIQIDFQINIVVTSLYIVMHLVK